MKRLLVVFVVLATIAIGNSCKKSNKATSLSPSMYIPWDMDSLMRGGPTAYPDYVSMLPVNGVLTACKVSGRLTDTLGTVNIYNRTWEVAAFSGHAGDLTGGVSAVSVNTVPIKVGVDGQYEHYDSAATWNEHSLNHWYTPGSGLVPAISADIDGAFPDFTGALPVTISTGSDFSITFNSSNTVNGDSAFVILYGFYDSTLWYGNDPCYSSVVNANGGSAIVTSKVLKDLHNGYFPLYADAHKPPYYRGGLIMLVIYNHTIQTIGGKQFAFVKQREVLGVVQFI